MKRLKFEWRALLAVPLLLISNAVLATISGSASPIFPATVVSGDDGTAVSLVLRLDQFTTDAPLPIVVQNDDDGTAKPNDGITLTMSCASATNPWDCLDYDAAVFDIVGNAGTGADLCAANTFTFSEPDASGEITVTVVGDPITFTAYTQFCTINFNVDVKELPKVLKMHRMV